jgi:predicted nucleic acid-binding protein
VTFLLDTNVLSEQRKPRSDRGVVTWLRQTAGGDLRLSVITIGEVRRGIARLEQRRDHAQAARYAGWLDTTIREFGERIIPVDINVAQRWADDHARRPTPTTDGLIGATAAVFGWTLVTRNTKDFSHLNIPLLNPFSEEVE